MDLKNKKVFVFGAAGSGISAVALLQKIGAQVILHDGNKQLKGENFQDRIQIEEQFTGYFGDLPPDALEGVTLFILSPGISVDHPLVVQAKSRNIPVWGEIELAYRYSKGRIAGITGTNGKTTTTTLVGEIMKTWFEEVYVVGNIGTPYSDIALKATENSVSVIELSSFQLETIHEFKPDISAILNITPDHLDRHYTMENYIRMKERIAKNQTEDEICILNYEDEILVKMKDRISPRVMFFSSARELEDGLFVLGEEIYYSDHGNRELICNINELKVLGSHNYENIMAAAGMAISMGVPMEFIRKAILTFAGVEHRIEYVDTIHGVSYYNDSKGTNPDASIKAVKAMRSPTVIIAGGYDKNSEYDEWIQAFGTKVKHLILIGQTKEKIAQAAARLGFHHITMAENLEEAVKLSAEQTESGDCVLLSPACASWGMFTNYEQRGDLFKEYVRNLHQNR